MYSGRCNNAERDKALKAARALVCSSLIKLLESKEASIYPDAQLEDSLHAQKLLQAMYRFKAEGRFTDCTVSSQVRFAALAKTLLTFSASSCREVLLGFQAIHESFDQ